MDYSTNNSKWPLGQNLLDKYKEVIQSLRDAYLNSNINVDYSEVIKRIIIDHNDLRASMSQCFNVIKVYPQKENVMLCLINDIIIDIARKGTTSRDYLKLYANLQFCENYNVSKIQLLAIMKDSKVFDINKLEEHVGQLDRLKSRLDEVNKQIKSYAFDTNGYKLLDKERREIKSVLKQYCYYDWASMDNSQNNNISDQSMNSVQILGFILLGILIVLAIVAICKLGFFGIIFLLGCPYLVISLCKGAGK